MVSGGASEKCVGSMLEGTKLLSGIHSITCMLVNEDTYVIMF